MLPRSKRWGVERLVTEVRAILGLASPEPGPIEADGLAGALEQASEALGRAVPDEMILKTSLIGTREMIAERISAYRDVGVSTLRLSTGGKDWKERTESLAEAVDFVKSLS